MPPIESTAARLATPSPERAARAMRRAERLAESGRVKEAILSLRLAIRYGADRYTCYLRLARLYQTRQQWREALLAATRAVEEDPGKLSAREALIALYLEAREYLKAIDASLQLLRMAPRHVPARDALGAAYIGIGDVEAAIRVANDLVRIDPDDPSHRYKRALLCQHQGEMELAIQDFERVEAVAEDSELAENARQQLDVIDSVQGADVLTLATDDPVFRARLIWETSAALQEKGFHLSEQGRQRVVEAVEALVTDEVLDWRPRTYH